MTRTRATPKLNFRDDQEEQLYLDFTAELVNDYSPLTASDRRQVSMAGTEYILAVRMQQDELSTGRIHLNSRYSHIQHMRQILTDLALSRSARLKEKPTSSTTEDELRELLFAVGKEPIGGQNGKKHVD